MAESRCTFCGSDRWQTRRTEYLYSHKGKYLLVPNTPMEVCLECGMTYFDAAVLKEIEEHFFAIHNRTEAPDRYIKMPSKAYA